MYVGSNPQEVVNNYYTYLEGHMDADSVSHMMHCNHLITDADYEAIIAAPNDNKINIVLLQYIRAMDSNLFIRFCEVLKNIETQKTIGDHLYTCKAIKSDSFASKHSLSSCIHTYICICMYICSICT